MKRFLAWLGGALYVAARLVVCLLIVVLFALVNELGLTLEQEGSFRTAEANENMELIQGLEDCIPMGPSGARFVCVKAAKDLFWQRMQEDQRSLFEERQKHKVWGF